MRLLGSLNRSDMVLRLSRSSQKKNEIAPRVFRSVLNILEDVSDNLTRPGKITIPQIPAVREPPTLWKMLLQIIQGVNFWQVQDPFGHLTLSLLKIDILVRMF